MASLQQLLKANAERHPDKTFIIEPETERKITFAEFQAEVDGFAETLRQKGFVSGKKALLIMNNSIRFATAFFAVIRLGGVAVPVNPASKESELKYLTEDSKSSYIITNDDIKSIAANDSDSEAPFALLLYTSGTTGKPKGVMLTEENLIAEASFIKQAHELTEEDTVLCVLPYFHINGLVVTLITPTYCGITIILPKKFSASAFWGLISQYKARWVSAVPTIYSIVLNKSAEGIDLSSLKFARSATSALPVAILKTFEQKTGVPIVESYGISEGGSQITSNPRPPKKCKAGSVGFPYGNEMKIVDGEVAVRGANISRGYYGKPEETAASFSR
jgi:acyl-CoA synthetase (AMP-forming)/AMP-acid ligase II